MTRPQEKMIGGRAFFYLGGEVWHIFITRTALRTI